MIDRDAEHRITQLETQMSERSQATAEFRAEIRRWFDAVNRQQIAVGQALGRLTAAFEAHLTEDRRILQRVNGNHRQEKLINTGMGVGFGAGVATILVAVLKALDVL